VFVMWVDHKGSLCPSNYEISVALSEGWNSTAIWGKWEMYFWNCLYRRTWNKTLQEYLFHL